MASRKGPGLQGDGTLPWGGGDAGVGVGTGLLGTSSAAAQWSGLWALLPHVQDCVPAGAPQPLFQAGPDALGVRGRVHTQAGQTSVRTGDHYPRAVSPAPGDATQGGRSGVLWASPFCGVDRSQAATLPCSHCTDRETEAHGGQDSHRIWSTWTQTLPGLLASNEN